MSDPLEEAFDRWAFELRQGELDLEPSPPPPPPFVLGPPPPPPFPEATPIAAGGLAETIERARRAAVGGPPKPPHEPGRAAVLCRARGCGARVFMVDTKNGKLMPIDVRPSDDGNVILEPQPNGGMPLARVLPPGQSELWKGKQLLYTAHFQTCTQAARYRKRTRRPGWEKP